MEAFLKSARTFVVYWRSVMVGSWEFAFGLVPGGWRKIGTSLVTFGVGCAAAYLGFFGDQTASEKAQIGIAGVIFSLALFAGLFVVGLIVIPPELDAKLRREKAIETANSEALATELSARGSEEDLLHVLSDLWTEGHALRGLYGHRGRSPWRADVFAWKTKALTRLAALARTNSFVNLNGWPSTYEDLKAHHQNPEQELLGLFTAELNVMAADRDGPAAKIIAQRGASSKASSPTA
jgi:hypothetical protein